MKLLVWIDCVVFKIIVCCKTDYIFIRYLRKKKKSSASIKIEEGYLLHAVRLAFGWKHQL